MLDSHFKKEEFKKAVKENVKMLTVTKRRLAKDGNRLPETLPF